MLNTEELYCPNVTSTEQDLQLIKRHQKYPTENVPTDALYTPNEKTLQTRLLIITLLQRLIAQ